VFRAGQWLIPHIFAGGGGKAPFTRFIVDEVSTIVDIS
jgi:hypothetical protein